MLAAMHTQFDNLSSNHSSESSHKHGEGEGLQVDSTLDHPAHIVLSFQG